MIESGNAYNELICVPSCFIVKEDLDEVWVICSDSLEEVMVVKIFGAVMFVGGLAALLKSALIAAYTGMPQGAIVVLCTTIALLGPFVIGRGGRAS
jgi:hypothetical protein